MFESTFFPQIADVYYATQTQNDFGDIEKTWSYNQQVRLQLNMSTNYKDQQMQPDQFFFMEDILDGRCRTDVRISKDGATYAMTDILLTNIRNDVNKVIYHETAGIREGQPSVYEVAGVLPHLDPFGCVDYYKVVIKRSDMQELLD